MIIVYIKHLHCLYILGWTFSQWLQKEKPTLRPVMRVWSQRLCLCEHKQNRYERSWRPVRMSSRSYRNSSAKANGSRRPQKATTKISDSRWAGLSWRTGTFDELKNIKTHLIAFWWCCKNRQNVCYGFFHLLMSKNILTV